MRIAVGGYHLEASTYNPQLSRAEDFRILRGKELLDAPAFAFLREFPAQFLPTFFARAVPGAPMARQTYEDFKSEFLQRLGDCGTIDGLYLCMHGGSFVEGMEDAEGDFIAAARDLVGPGCPISVSYDLHGNLSQRIVDCIDLFTAYRTAPHIDTEETLRRAVSMLVRAIETGVTPKLCWAPIPVVLQGERTVTTAEPARSLYGRLGPIQAANPDIWDAALMVGFVWADEPRVTAAALMTGTDRAAMEREAANLAKGYWDAREQFAFGSRTGSVEDCVRWAMESSTGPVFLSDSGDNVTAGGAGDRVDLLRALLDAKAEGVIVAGIMDRQATEGAYLAGVNATFHVILGYSLVPTGLEAVEADARVIALFDTASRDEREAVLDIGGISVVVTARRKPFITLADFVRLGLDPNEARIIVVKLGYLFPELAPLANPAIMALSHGIVDQFPERLPRSRTRVPTFPFQRDFSYAPEVFWSKRSTD